MLLIIQPVFAGFYAGASPDIIWMKAKQRFIFDPAKVNNTSMYNRTDSFGTVNFNLSIRAGYEHSLENIYMAGEVEDTFMPARVTKENFDLYTKITQNNSLGIKVKLGRHLSTSQTIYMTGGYTFTWHKYQVDFKSGGRYNSGTMLLSNISKRNIATGPVIGAGLKTKLSRNIDGFVEYTHTFYATDSYDINHRTITFNNPKGTSDILLNTDEFKIGLAYHLN